MKKHVQILLNILVIFQQFISVLLIEAKCLGMLLIDPYWTTFDMIDLCLLTFILLFSHYFLLCFLFAKKALKRATAISLTLFDLVVSVSVLIVLCAPHGYLVPIAELWIPFISIQTILFILRIGWLGFTLFAQNARSKRQEKQTNSAVVPSQVDRDPPSSTKE